ncbi:MAG: UvrD-helicase domain-containing protein [Opitutaceae bacterium]|jgi:DNA helicase-2/ATP-dependent DNA helicase PcrA|nr:UvrD-helicase domain-containing protein [Opitutaceae bacterium]
MSFYADLHIHSKYSRATSGDLDFRHLALWAKKKGIRVVATGDFTHPAWMAAIRDELVPAEPGLFRLRDDLEAAVNAEIGPCAASAAPVRFLLEVEISTIYKQGDKVRKVHHLLYAPDIASAERMTGRLARIGNLASDGRPILGLNSRDLLEICLSAGEGCYLIPAHIWTPWFSVFGSKSGFDRLEECYGDLSTHIFALETGLSSDPAMNWQLSMLDGYRLVSSSDAHSPGNLGREASRFDCAMDYFAIRDALATGRGYAGSVEFFPEEGKYHMDGHRACNFRCEPAESRRLGGKCPVCGAPLTLGVHYRVLELADRAEPQKPAGAAAFRSFIPLPEVLGEIHGTGSKSKTVRTAWEQAIARLGTELDVLGDLPVDEIGRATSPLLAEAIRRMRAGEVICQGGFDGEYGVIRVFKPGEVEATQSVGVLFDLPEPAKPEKSGAGVSPATVASPFRRGTGFQPVSVASPQCGAGVSPATPQHELPARDSEAGGTPAPHDQETRTPSEARAPIAHSPPPPPLLAGLDPDQRAAAAIVSGPLLIIAGPGTGKTRTLTHRIAHLIADHGAPPESCLAITFTRRAAGEMRERLRHLLPDGRGARAPVTTFHALGLTILREQQARLDLGAPLRVAGEREALDLAREILGVSAADARRLLANRQEMPAAWTQAMRARGLVDFDDLIALTVDLFAADPALAAHYRTRWPHLSIDEYQDVDERQYQLIQYLTGAKGFSILDSRFSIEGAAAPNANGSGSSPIENRESKIENSTSLCAIGDPDQAIYGFRGTDVRFFQQFRTDYADAHVVQLTRNYRSARPIVEAALQAVAPTTLVRDRALYAQNPDATRLLLRECGTDRAEAEFVVETIERLVGGTSLTSFDTGRASGAVAPTHYAFNDIAILYRTDAQTPSLVEALSRSGIPFQKRAHGPLSAHATVQALVTRIKTLPPDTPLAERLAQASAALALADQPDADLRPITDALHPLAEKHGADLDAFRSELALGVDVDLHDARAERVSLLTLHAAKGLEFRVVFLVGCEDGLLPHHFGFGNNDSDAETDIAEERRLFFVGITRAKDRLFLTHARRRHWQGALRDRYPSPFLSDIRDTHLDRHREEPPATPRARQLDLF